MAGYSLVVDISRNLSSKIISLVDPLGGVVMRTKFTGDGHWAIDECKTLAELFDCKHASWSEVCHRREDYLGVTYEIWVLRSGDGHHLYISRNGNESFGSPDDLEHAFFLINEDKTKTGNANVEGRLTCIAEKCS
jgi:sarcosine oxidase delta subunit